jgi:hypothetical protein
MWFGGVVVGTVAPGDVETGVISGPRIAPPWSRVSGVLRYSDLAEGSYVTRFEVRRARGGDFEIFVYPQEHTTPLDRKKDVG